MRINALTSAANPLLKKIRSLHERAARQKAGLFLLEGEKIILEAVDRGVEIDALVMENAYFERGISHNLESAFAAAESPDTQNIEINVVPENLFKDLCTTASSCGVIAVGVQLEATLDDLLAMCQDGEKNTIVVLEAIQDPGNLGTIIRSALAFDARAVVLTRGTVDCYNPKVVRAAMGALFDLPVLVDADLGETLEALKERGFVACALNPEAEESLTDKKIPDNLVLLLGNEGAGLTAAATEMADLDLNIKISSQIESLNVSIAASVVLFYLSTR